ncbi:unnamed protein product [Blepharisma stoltei]|uniref:Peptidase A1 domain-containing protein n=1 Tax=Blepharisma stoltei TaxID=1481888 RepID=A0AAU9IXC5_9CILI|nr:unnamed protein product [Blepharisma stoltei]
MLQTLLNDYSCKIDSSSYMSCDCDGKYPKLNFVFSGKVFTLSPIDYFVIEDDKCYPTLHYNSKINYWILGEGFIRRFYLHFDMDQMRIGFAKSITKSSEGMATWLLAVIITCSVIGFILICACLGVYIYKK